MEGSKNVMTLGDIKRLANALQAAEDEQFRHEQAAKNAAAVARRLREDVIPCALWEAGVQAAVMDDNKTLKLSFQVFGSIPASGERAEKAFDWLEENGFGAIVKRSAVLEIPADQVPLVSDLREFAAQHGLGYAFKRAVHPQTLYAFLKEQLNTDIPLELFNAQPTFKATLK